MRISTEPHVIGQIPADVVGVLVDDDVVGVPQPAVAVHHVRGCDAPVPTIEPEAPRAAASQVPHMAAAKAAGEPAMLPRLIHVVADIVMAGVMANPDLPVHMR